MYILLCSKIFWHTSMTLIFLRVNYVPYLSLQNQLSCDRTIFILKYKENAQKYVSSV